MIVYIPHLTKMLLKEIKITLKSLQDNPVVLVADDRSKLVEADHPSDEGTSEIFISTKSSILETPICFCSR